MEGRIHLRTFDDCLRRLAVYWADPAFSRQIEETITHFQADGLAKLTAEDRERHTAANAEFAQRFDAIMQDAKIPVWITRHPEYKKPAVGLDEFTKWSYSQVEHATDCLS